MKFPRGDSVVLCVFPAGLTGDAAGWFGIERAVHIDASCATEPTAYAPAARRILMFGYGIIGTVVIIALVVA